MIHSDQNKNDSPQVRLADAAFETLIYRKNQSCFTGLSGTRAQATPLGGHKLLSVWVFSLLAFLSVFAMSKPASASTWPWSDSLNLVNMSCPAGSEQYQELTELKSRISAAQTVELAKEIALEPTEQAIGVLENANTLMPYSDDLLSAKNRLNDARDRIMLASSQAEVADEFSGMMLAGLDDDRIAQVKVGKAGCSYSSGETIAIVIGLILGIIPGLILLVVLC